MLQRVLAFVPESERPFVRLMASIIGPVAFGVWIMNELDASAKVHRVEQLQAVKRVEEQDKEKGITREEWKRMQQMKPRHPFE